MHVTILNDRADKHMQITITKRDDGVSRDEKINDNSTKWITNFERTCATDSPELK